MLIFIYEGTSTNEPTTNQGKNFGNSLRGPPKEKLNKTGKIIDTSASDEPTRTPIRKFGNSMRGLPTEKLNKTGKITTNDASDLDESPPRTKPKHILSVLRKHNSLQKSAKLNKTGKIEVYS